MSAEDAIRKMVDDWLQASRRGGEAGAAGYASFATEDAVFLPPNSERLEGPAAIKEAMVDLTSMDGFDITWNVSRIDVAADGAHAHILGEYELSARDPDGNPIADRGKYFDALEKQDDGSWLCSVACWNSSLPVA
ncbi:MAG: SgcJ/EcaC family oxidoreductase [Gemmatimonadetes bacterium]|nr:SgcJ/EcaC family oxidoreductase [Gemmatimonadota bacterium]